MKTAKRQPKIGDIIKITFTPDNYGIGSGDFDFGFFQVGDLGRVSRKDDDGDWYATFDDMGNPIVDDSCGA